ncbi:hypothetical protein GCM10009659_31480 [Leucobacter albus]
MNMLGDGSRAGAGAGAVGAGGECGDGLAVRAVTVAYRRDEPVVRGASFDVQRGEVVALLGPSGCGKSTLLRAIAGLEPLAGGSVSWGGEDLARVPAHRREFGLVFQDGQLFAHRNVAENIAYGLRVKRWNRQAREARVGELLDLVGLPELGARPVTELSGGQRQRVALARALAPSPRLLLLDEPLSALDRELRDRLAVDLAELLRATGTTAMLVTHDEGEAETIAGRVLRMREGLVAE